MVNRPAIVLINNNKKYEYQSQYSTKKLWDTLNQDDTYKALEKFSKTSAPGLRGAIDRVHLDPTDLDWVEFKSTESHEILKINFEDLKTKAREIELLSGWMPNVYCFVGMWSDVCTVAVYVGLAMGAKALVLSLWAGVHPVIVPLITVGLFAHCVYASYRLRKANMNAFLKAHQKCEKLKTEYHWDKLKPVYQQIKLWVDDVTYRRCDQDWMKPSSKHATSPTLAVVTA